MFALEIFLQLQFATLATGEQRRGSGAVERPARWDRRITFVRTEAADLYDAQVAMKPVRSFGCWLVQE